MKLAVDIYDQKTEVNLDALAEDAQLRETVFLPLGLDVVDVWRFDDEFGIKLQKSNVSVRIDGDPYCDLWKNNSLISSRFGQGGYLVFSISSFDQVALKRTLNLLVARFEDSVVV